MTATDIDVIAVTGPTRGLGAELVRRLAVSRPAPVLVLLGRAGPALDGALHGAREAGATGSIAVPCDLASLADVHRATAEVRAAVADGRIPPLTALVANAGVQTVDRRQRTADGHELTFGVNVLATHVLVESLRTALVPGAHVMLLGSSTHHGDRSLGLVDPPRWEDPLVLARPDGLDGEPRAGSRAYATSKLAVLHQAHEWDRRYGDGPSALHVVVYDPGLMPGTGLARMFGPGRRFAWSFVLPLLRVLPGVTSPRRSAAHLADLVLGRRHARLRGAYVRLGTPTDPAPASFDAERERRLWEVSEQLTRPVRASAPA
jgi:NAD(P)-dependent dehydrogenase (short-subunit alcohol dehydrogenase family)